ncbi:MAG: hypothetical protein OEV42_12975 [Deltaproteobacteria bacterium]|nr:hypothetical protein [Deltaproteobacteria bacterium]
MASNIHYEYDAEINGYIVRMPAFVRFDSLNEWFEMFNRELSSIPSNQPLVLLIDTNEHKFESIQCLKSLREFFINNKVVKKSGVKAAFVGPGQYMEPHIKSDLEAYFDSFDEAYSWLKK